jgi:hypothetical protein
MWVAVGSGINNIAYSYNGTTWTGVGSAVTLFGSSSIGFDVSWNGTMWIAIGNGSTNTMIYSYDGINWLSGIEHVFSSNGTGPLSHLTFDGDANDISENKNNPTTSTIKFTEDRNGNNNGAGLFSGYAWSSKTGDDGLFR